MVFFPRQEYEGREMLAAPYIYLISCPSGPRAQKRALGYYGRLGRVRLPQVRAMWSSQVPRRDAGGFNRCKGSHTWKGTGVCLVFTISEPVLRSAGFVLRQQLGNSGHNQSSRTLAPRGQTTEPQVTGRGLAPGRSVSTWGH